MLSEDVKGEKGQKINCECYNYSAKLRPIVHHRTHVAPTVKVGFVVY